MARDLARIGEKARTERKTVFTSIYHFVNDMDHLRACYEKMEKGKAPGMDGVTKEEYGRGLERNLEELSAVLGRQEYEPKPALRKYIPKIGSTTKRPLGLQCFEDKVVQKSMAEVLEEIYEADFLRCSYGYRRGHTCHEALAGLGRTIQQRKINYIVEADVKGYFDHVNHEWLMKCLRVRIGDERVLWLIEKMLKAGVMEEGLTKASEEGVPQGGVLSAVLSNVYLHYVLDLWFERRFRLGCQGEAYLFRYADDFVACFQNQEDAERYREAMEVRLREFNLEIEPSKTKLLRFGATASEEAEREGQNPESFDFLGFTHYCGHTRLGHFKVKRRTSKKKFRGKLKEVTVWLKTNRSLLKKSELLRRAKARVEGHLNYYAITDNGPACNDYLYQVRRLLFKWMNRQSQKRSYTWDRFAHALAWVKWPQVRIRTNLSPFVPLSASK